SVKPPLSPEDTVATGVPRPSRTAETAAPATAARIGSTICPRNTVVCAYEGADEARRRAARTPVRLSLIVRDGLYTRPFQSVKTDSVAIPSSSLTEPGTYPFRPSR